MATINMGLIASRVFGDTPPTNTSVEFSASGADANWPLGIYRYNDGAWINAYTAYVADGSITWAKLSPATLSDQISSTGGEEKLVSADTIFTYVEQRVSELSEIYLPLTGGTLQGPLLLSEAPTDDSHAVRKSYVDNSFTEQLGNYLPLTGGGVSGDISLGNAPTDDSHAVRKSYVDSLINGLRWKDSARGLIATTEALSGTYTTADGVVLVVGDRVVRNSATTQTNNGIWVVASGAWARSIDANTGVKLRQAAIFIEGGVSFADRFLVVTNDTTITIGSTNIVFASSSGGVTYTAGSGISISGTTIAVDFSVAQQKITAGTGITLSGVSVAVDFTAIQPRVTTVTVLGASVTSLNLNNVLQTRATASGVNETIAITSFSNTGIGKDIRLSISSANLGDIFTIVVAGATIVQTGFNFIPGVLNYVHIQQIDTAVYEVAINPIIS